MREEFIMLLTRLVMDGFITMAEARVLVDEFDKIDALPEGWALPLPIDDAIPGDLDEMIARNIDFFIGERNVTVELIQDEQNELVVIIAKQLAAGEITLKRWHEMMLTLLVDYYARMAAAGSQGNVGVEDADDLFSKIEIQLAFLSRFADQIGSGRLSDAQVEERSKLYAGEGRAIYYEQAGKLNNQPGNVEDYVAVDDKNTCGPCEAAEANSPYLPGSGPMPGRVCLGRGYCRCTRVLRYDPQAYLRLT